MLLSIDNQQFIYMLLCKQSSLFFFNKANHPIKRKHIAEVQNLQYAFVYIKINIFIFYNRGISLKCVMPFSTTNWWYRSLYLPNLPPSNRNTL